MLRFLFFLGFVRPLVYLFLGVNIRNRALLPKSGPAIIVANHNSHLDTLVLISLFPLQMLRSVRPVAAADYWLKNGMIAWFANHIVGIVPVERCSDKRSGDVLAPISKAIEEKSILIFFPEGSRGEAEQMTKFRSGIARIAERHPEVPITPVFLHGLGKSLPRGEGVLVPFICDAFVGNPVYWNYDRVGFLSTLESDIKKLAEEARLVSWQ